MLRSIAAVGHGSRLDFKDAHDLRALCDLGTLDKAMDVLLCLEQRGTVPSVETYSYIVKACIKKKALTEAKQLHAHMIRNGFQSHGYLGEFVVEMMVQCGSVADALDIFYRISTRTVFAWTVIITAHTKNRQHQQALRLYREMQEKGVRPNKYTFRALVKSCSSLRDLEVGKRVHEDAMRCGCSSDIIVGTTLIDMYAKCGSMTDAQAVFETLEHRDSVSWNVLIMGYSQQGQPEVGLQIFSRMQNEQVAPDGRTLVGALKACGLLAVKEEAKFVDGQWKKASCLRQGRILHSLIVEMGCLESPFVGSTLLHMYSNCGSIEEARQVFDALTHRDVVSWNAMLAGYSQQGQDTRALQLYADMQVAGVAPDNRTYVSLIKACGSLATKEDSTCTHDGQSVKRKSLQKGMAIHKELMSRGFKSDVFIGNSLVHMYSNCGSLVEAQKAFDSLARRDVVSWNSMIAGFSQQNQGQQALNLYAQMLEEHIRPDDWTYVSLLTACSSLAATEEKKFADGQSLKPESLRKGMSIHADIVRNGRGSVAHVSSALLHMYSTCGNVREARNVFETLNQCDVVTWNAMIAGYAQQEQNENALHLYAKMRKEGVAPNESTFLSTLKACGNSGALEICSRIHCDIVKSGFQQDASVGNSLLHAYGKCGDMLEARCVFNSLPSRDVVAWNTLIEGYSRQGEYIACFQCFEEMEQTGAKPDEVTFLSLLSACSHAGMVDKGLKYFESMTTVHGITAEIEHYVSMVDLLGRAGLFQRVEDLLSTMPMLPDCTLWVSLLGACRKHVNVELGRRAFEGAVSLDPGRSAAYVLMSNLYSHALRWDNAKEIDSLRSSAIVWKEPGKSWIEHNHAVHTFKVGKNSHAETEQVYAKVKELNTLLDEEAREFEPGDRLSFTSSLRFCKTAHWSVNRNS